MRYRKFLSYFGFPYIVYKSASPFNGEIKVISLYGRYSISVDNLTQSGPIVEGLWRKAITRIKNYELRIKNILVLGVAGGSVIKVLRQFYPNAKITGIEIDQKMINIARKYFNLDDCRAKIVIDDAFSFVNKPEQKQYDLIIVDILKGREAPSKLSKTTFLYALKKILLRDGIIIFNRLRLKKSKESMDFINNLTETFSKITINKPLVNTFIYCQ